MNAGLDHLLSVFGLGALPDGLAFLERNLLLLRVLVVEADTLVEGDWLLILVLDFEIHALVLVSVITHLVEAGVFLSAAGFLVDDLSKAVKCGLKLLPGDFPVLIRVELLHKQINFIFERWEPIRLEQQYLDLLAGDEAAAIAIDAFEGRLELLVGENVETERVCQSRLELVWGSQGSYTEESHY